MKMVLHLMALEFINRVFISVFEVGVRVERVDGRMEKVGGRMEEVDGRSELVVDRWWVGGVSGWIDWVGDIKCGVDDRNCYNRHFHDYTHHYCNIYNLHHHNNHLNKTNN